MNYGASTASRQALGGAPIVRNLQFAILAVSAYAKGMHSQKEGPMRTLEVLARDGFVALEEKQTAYPMRRLDAILLELQDMDDFLTDIIDRQHRRNPERKASIPAC
jgi:hypothetical protein